MCGGHVQGTGSVAVEAEQAELSFKLIIVGDSGVGKSAILHRFAQVRQSIPPMMVHVQS